MPLIGLRPRQAQVGEHERQSQEGSFHATEENIEGRSAFRRELLSDVYIDFVMFQVFFFNAGPTNYNCNVIE